MSVAATASAVNTERGSRWADVPQRDPDGFLLHVFDLPFGVNLERFGFSYVGLPDTF